MHAFLSWYVRLIPWTTAPKTVIQPIVRMHAFLSWYVRLIPWTTAPKTVIQHFTDKIQLQLTLLLKTINKLSSYSVHRLYAYL